MRILKFLLITTFGFLGVSLSAYAEYKLNMPVGVTPISQDIYNLHMTIFWVCVAIGVVVFGVMFYSLWAHRRSRGAKAATFHGNVRVEILWAVIPFLILVIMAIPATQVLVRMEDSDDADVNIKVVGYQWYWKYEYLDEGIAFASHLSTPMDQVKNKAPKDQWYLLEVDKPLVIPIHKKVRFLVTANDVIHSWWVPDLGIKRDAIPGFIHEAWARVEKPGIYRGQCAELCGINHGFMPIVVDARTEADYEKWVAQQRVLGQAELIKKMQLAAKKNWTDAELINHGEEVYGDNCAACHKADGTGRPPHFPSIKGSKIATGPVDRQIDIVLHGKGIMPAWASRLSDADIAAVISYERNTWGNNNQQRYGQNAGGIVTPAEIAAARQK